jgi:hypothetical protein
MTMDVRSIEDIKESLKNTQQARHPYLRDYSDYSVLSTINEAIAIQIQYIEQCAKNAIESNSIWTATGDDLDILVVDRGIERQAGNRSSGILLFRTALPATNTITIPIGTVVSAIGADGNKVYFETVEEGNILPGYVSVTVNAQSIETGEENNVPEYTINNMRDYIKDVARVENTLPFYGGTEEESDTDLRNRYKYATDINGRATLPLMEQHIYDLETVRECQIYQAGPGEIEVIADSEMLTTNDQTVVDCIEANMAVGIVSRGKKLASITSGVIAANIGEIEAGKLIVRVMSPLVSPNESFTIDYTSKTGLSRTALVTVPTGSTAGDIAEVVLQDSDDFVVNVTGCTYVGSSSYDILGGLGEYPHLYLLPRKVLVNVRIGIIQTDTPDPSLQTKVEDSIKAFLDAFYIGDTLEFSDLVMYIYKDFTTGEEFEGIDQITSVIVTANGESINGFGQVIDIDNDQRFDPGTVTATLT